MQIIPAVRVMRGVSTVLHASSVRFTAERGFFFFVFFSFFSLLPSKTRARAEMVYYHRNHTDTPQGYTVRHTRPVLDTPLGRVRQKCPEVRQNTVSPTRLQAVTGCVVKLLALQWEVKADWASDNELFFYESICFFSFFFFCKNTLEFNNIWGIFLMRSGTFLCR